MTSTQKKKPNPIMQLRCDPVLRKSFDDCAAANDRTRSQLIRDYMRDYIKKNSQGNLTL